MKMLTLSDSLTTILNGNQVGLLPVERPALAIPCAMNSFCLAAWHRSCDTGNSSSRQLDVGWGLALLAEAFQSGNGVSWKHVAKCNYHKNCHFILYLKMCVLLQGRNNRFRHKVTVLSEFYYISFPYTVCWLYPQQTLKKPMKNIWKKSNGTQNTNKLRTEMQIPVLCWPWLLILYSSACMCSANSITGKQIASKGCKEGALAASVVVPPCKIIWYGSHRLGNNRQQ